MDWLLRIRRWSAFWAIELGMVTALVVALREDRLQVRPVATEENPYSLHAIYVQGCTCAAPCPGELVGTAMAGCKTAGAMQILAGTFQNTDLTGARIAFAAVRGQWIKIYVDGRDRDQKAAAAAFAREALKDYGPVRATREGKIELVGRGGDFLISVENGGVMQMMTEPVIGGDGRTPLAHANTRNKLNPTLQQGRVNQGRFEDGEDSFRMEGTNAYFNETMLATGRL